MRIPLPKLKVKKGSTSRLSKTYLKGGVSISSSDKGSLSLSSPGVAEPDSDAGLDEDRGQGKISAYYDHTPHEASEFDVIEKMSMTEAGEKVSKKFVLKNKSQKNDYEMNIP